jgi:hypothetical protein
MEGLQNHIHMDTALSASPELAPIQKWKTVDRGEVPEVVGSIKSSINGDLIWHVSGDENGVHRRTHMRYVIKLVDDGVLTLEQQKTVLLNMHGQFVYLVDHWHCANGEDHTNWVVPYLLHTVGDIVPVGPMLPFYTVAIELTSASLITNSQPKVGWILEDTDYGAIGSTARL